MKSPLGSKLQKLAIGALAVAALSVPALTSVSASAHADHGWRNHSDSQRLALSVTSNSLRLT
jgi:hypothetical protein